ncbi:MAG TPA: hypothetical protein VGL59_18410 [Polyangia bacterium]|jgi:hypothetical protein
MLADFVPVNFWRKSRDFLGKTRFLAFRNGTRAVTLQVAQSIDPAIATIVGP